MPIDFDALVLGPCMDTFAEPITVDPLASQPSAPPYTAQGIFSSAPYDVPLADGTLYQDQRTTIGMQISQFSVPPTAKDLITVRGVQYIAADAQADGQGGLTLTLRRNTPPMVTC